LLKSTHKFRAAAWLGIFALALGGAVGFAITSPSTVGGQLPPHTANLANGEAAFNAGGCASCHTTPDQPERLLLGGGLAIHSPFGTFYAPNISPDSEDGIGGWSERDFVTAMTKGTSPKGQHYYPAFPYASYQHASIGDLRDMFAYLKTLPAASGKVRDHDLGFPFNIRRAVGVWKALHLGSDDAALTKPSADAKINRGAYLVNGLGHCAECHSPRDALGGIVAGQRLAGGPNPEGEGWVPNITRKGLKDWSESDIAHFLKTGETPDGDTTGGSMVRVVRNTARLSDADRAAIAAYLKSLPAVEGPARPKRS